MAVFSGSRFEGIDYTLIIKDGVPKKFLHLRTPLKSSNVKDFVLHDVELNETLDIIAMAAYNEPKYWYILAETNEIDFPITITEGTKLIVPTLEFA